MTLVKGKIACQKQIFEQGHVRRAEKGHRRKRGNRLWAGQELHRGELAGSVDGKLRKNQAAPIDLQNLARLSEEPHQTADR